MLILIISGNNYRTRAIPQRSVLESGTRSSESRGPVLDPETLRYHNQSENEHVYKCSCNSLICASGSEC